MGVYAGWAKAMVVERLRGKTIKAALVADYDQSVMGHYLWSQVQPFEVSGENYPAGGALALLVAHALQPDGEAPVVRIDCPAIDFGVLGVDHVSGVVFYEDTGNPNTSFLIAADMFDSDVELAGLEFVYSGEYLTELVLEDQTVIEA